MNFQRFVLFVLLTSLVGCAALKKRQDAPTVTQEVNLKPSFDQALSNGDFTNGDWPEWNWWVSFGDGQLSAFMDQAIADNPDLMAAISRVRSSEQEARKVRSVLFPQFNASFEDDYQHLSKDALIRFPPSPVPAVVNQINLKLNFEYEIDLFGKNRETYQAAIGEARAQRAEMSQAYLIVTVSLAQAYFDFQANLLRIDAQKEVVQAQKKLVELTEKRVLNNLDDAITLEKAVSNLLKDEELLTEYEKNLALSQSQIKILMGLSPDDEMKFQMPQAEYLRPFPLPENLPLNLLVRRPDLMMQIWKVEAAAHLIGAARAAFFPNINLAAFAGLESLTWAKLFSIESFAGLVAPAINLPLFTGWKLTAGLEQSFANYDTAVFDYNSLILKAAKEVSDGVKILQASNRETKFQMGVVGSLKKATDLTYARYENGVDNFLQVLEMKLELLQQVIREVDLQNIRHLSVLNLIRALGGGYYQQKKEVIVNE
ncbi:MAG: efflux transporter outer membrane subunit [Simkania sp.]|nr:efflux transporter outer membrane subunit [Simkania sp.]